jgi:glutaconate CoA-transferase subunit A
VGFFQPGAHQFRSGLCDGSVEFCVRGYRDQNSRILRGSLGLRSTGQFFVDLYQQEDPAEKGAIGRMVKLKSMSEAIAELVPDGATIALGLQMEQMIPFAAGHEIIRQKKRELTLIGPISDILFDQLIGAGSVSMVIAAWVGNVMMGSAYNFRRAVERGEMRVRNLTNFTVALALQAGAMGVPFLPTRTALGSDIAPENEFFAPINSPFPEEKPGERERHDGRPTRMGELPGVPSKMYAVRAIRPDVTIVNVQRADRDGNAHCWGNFGVLLEGVRAAKRVIVVAEEIVEPDVIASDPNRTVIPGFLVNAVVECPLGAHPSPVQGYYKRDDAFFRQYHEQTKTKSDSDGWLTRWVYDVADRRDYVNQLGGCRVQELRVKQHAYAAPTDYGY